MNPTTAQYKSKASRTQTDPIKPDVEYPLKPIYRVGKGIAHMRIAILTSVLEEGPSGVGLHVVRLIEELTKLDPTSTFFLIQRTHRTDGQNPQITQSFPQKIIDAPNFQPVPVYCPKWMTHRARWFYQAILLPRVLRKLQVDLVHGPGQQVPVPHKQNGHRVPQLLTVHDLAEAGMKFAPADRIGALEKRLARYLRWADHYIALSKFTKQDLVEHFNIAPQQINVIYEGGGVTANADQHISPNTQPTQHSAQSAPSNPDTTSTSDWQSALNRPYVLYAGAIEPRRNVMFLVNAFARLRQIVGPEYNLILAGRCDPDEARRLKQQALACGIGDDVIFTGYVQSKHMQELYERASAFVMPSLHEGFGMAVLEAMTHGVPVIAARAGALPEVVGNAGLLVDLDDVNGLTQAMKSLLTDGVMALDYIQRGEKRVTQFSWKRMAEQTWMLYKQLIQSQMT